MKRGAEFRLRQTGKNPTRLSAMCSGELAEMPSPHAKPLARRSCCLIWEISPVKVVKYIRYQGGSVSYVRRYLSATCSASVSCGRSETKEDEESVTDSMSHCRF